MIINKIKYFSILSLTALFIVSCETEDYTFPVEEAPALDAGSANFSTYVSVGNSLTAGFTDGALFLAGQENSMPNLLAQKFAMIGGGDFSQPLTNDNVGGLLLGGTMIQEPRLIFTGSDIMRLDATPTNEIGAPSPGPYNNMGVPGAKSFHLLANGYGNVAGVPTGQANPYFVRMASNPNASVLEDAASQGASFVTLWIGANDVLSYSLAGGAGVDQTGNPDPTTYGSTDISDPTLFAGVYSAILSTLTGNGAQGVVLNIPDVTSIPYFTTIPYNPVPLDAATADQLNQAYAAYNQGMLQAEAVGFISTEEREARTITFVQGQNAVVITDEYLTDLSAFGAPSIRQATPEDLIVLPAKSFIGTLVNNDPTLINGVSVPLDDNWVLTTNEQTEVSNATMAYNQTIEQLATQNGLAFVDVNTLMQQVVNGGIMFDEFNMTGQLVFGNTFSLDGVHPTARGYAFIANEILKAIDATYGSNFQAAGMLYNADDFTTMYAPNL